MTKDEGDSAGNAAAPNNGKEVAAADYESVYGLLEAGKMAEAEAILRKVLTSDPDHAGAHNDLGVIVSHRGEIERAVDHFEKAIELAPDSADAYTNLGNLYHAAGRFDDSAKVYRKAVTLDPRDADTQTNLGTSLQALGRVEAAAASYRRALVIDPEHLFALNNLGNTLQALGRMEEAVASFRRALMIKPDFALALGNLGNVLHIQGKLTEAEDTMRRAIEAEPGFAMAHSNLGHVLTKQGKLEAAVAAYRKALELKPDYAEAHYNLGHVLTRQGKLEAAVTSFERAIRSRADYAEAHYSLAHVLDAQGKFDEAAVGFHRALDLDPNSAEIYNGLGNVLVKLGKLQEAITALRRALAIKPDYVSAITSLGAAFLAQGKFDEANARFREALALKPDCADAYAGLAKTTRFVTSDDEIARFERLVNDEETNAKEKIGLHFVMAKICDDMQLYDKAFTHYKIGNDLRKQNIEFDGEKLNDYVDRVISLFCLDFFKERTAFGSGSDLPILIVGMPRSGTTLVEQILSSHPQVCGAGELYDLYWVEKSLHERLQTTTPYPECAALMDAETARRISDEYLGRLRGLGGAALRVSDKAADNFVRLGLVALLIPHARVIHCRRDPLDLCLSCYFQDFAHGQYFSFDLTTLGIAYREYERLIEHWRNIPRIRMLDVQYEELVTNQQEVSRRLIDFCGLEWDERCLAFHTNDRPVRTASAWQVRQPIYTTSIGRWKLYEKHLGPLKRALEAREV